MIACYLRISYDPLNLQAGIDRQRADCHAIAAIRWPDQPVTEYVDNDISAYSGKPRPAYQDMIGTRPAAIVAWNLDRLLRQPRDLEHLIDLGIPIITAQGDLDLTTHDGQLHARILAAVAKKSSDDTSRRVSRAMRDRAEQGWYNGGVEPYGYRWDATVNTWLVVPDQAVHVRAAFNLAVEGGSFLSMIRPPIVGAPITDQAWRSIVTKPIYAARLPSGQPASWEPIIDSGLFDRVQAAMLHRRWTGERTTRVHWVRRILRCGVCDGTLRAHGGLGYRCEGHVHTRQTLIEPFVEGALFAATIVEPADPVSVEPTVDVSERLGHLAGLYAQGVLTRVEWESARAVVQEATPPVLVVQRLPENLEAAWPGLSLHQRERILRQVFDKIVVHPVARGRQVDPFRRFQIVYRR